MVVKLIIAYPFHVLHTVLMYKFDEHVLLTFVKIGNAGDYSGHEIVMWDTMDPTFTRADGLSSPKVLRTKGSDGKWYKLIWKNEDVRQDCLVEQLFSVVSGIMNHDETSSFLRTYKVVPLNSKCGIIEFCQGTISLSVHFHLSFYSVINMPVNQASATFRQACALFKPVFRHFFYHHCRTVNQWTSMIDNYRRSLAQWSIATYVIGLGDRHLSNILFEIDTCKLVHIDLGMIFEYSKRTLPIPERVPFRLTRDLLDPILIEGIGGRLLEEAVYAMKLLRENNSKVILGLASVLLRETISNFEEVESNNGDRPSFVSETAIARLRDKLNGTDDTLVQQDVLHQVFYCVYMSFLGLLQMYFYQ
ncbi:unnamed protein product [Angiostrongylus costaricensis]|uniref:PI3K/PI4K domain-containing protein n=1 Tax=Angiostrongylus costaricensis TaxID=334426 RepID=A0A158PI64_ANGCS|nr:unnamed protein product [Angiostrongylus costaricensis]